MSKENTAFRSETKRVRGLGSAHHGTAHFWLQRTTAIAIIPLSVWFMVKILTIFATANRDGVQQWFHNPLNALLMAVLVVAMFWHAKLGVQVIVEDYVHCKCKKITMLLLNSGLKIILGALCLLAIARLHFGM